MRKELKIERKKEVLSLVTEIAYSQVPDWYGAVYANLKMNLIIPKEREGHRKQPTILWICGGAYSVVSNSAWMPELMYFAERGYTVASIEYRTSNKAPFPAGIIDVKSAIRFLKAHADMYCINPNQIYIMGESAGGTYAVLAGATPNKCEWEEGDYLNYTSTVAGVVDFYGLVDFTTVFVVKNEIVPSWTVPAYLGECETSEHLKEASPLYYVDSQTPPTMILHGTSDETVPIMQSEALYEKLKKYQIPCQYITIKGAAHGDALFYQDEILKQVHQFLQKCINECEKSEKPIPLQPY